MYENLCRLQAILRARVPFSLCACTHARTHTHTHAHAYTHEYACKHPAHCSRRNRIKRKYLPLNRSRRLRHLRTEYRTTSSPQKIPTLFLPLTHTRAHTHTHAPCSLLQVDDPLVGMLPPGMGMPPNPMLMGLPAGPQGMPMMMGGGGGMMPGLPGGPFMGGRIPISKCSSLCVCVCLCVCLCVCVCVCERVCVCVCERV